MKLIMENWRRYRQKAKLVNILLEARPIKVDKEEVDRVVELMYRKVLKFFEVPPHFKHSYEKSYFENNELSEIPWVFGKRSQKKEGRTYSRDYLIDKIRVPLVGSHLGKSVSRKSEESEYNKPMFYEVDIVLALYSEDEYRNVKEFSNSGYAKFDKTMEVPSARSTFNKRDIASYIKINVNADFSKYDYEVGENFFKKQVRGVLTHELIHTMDYWGGKSGNLYMRFRTLEDFEQKPKFLIKDVLRLKKNNIIDNDEAEELKSIIRKGRKAEKSEKIRVIQSINDGYTNQKSEIRANMGSFTNDIVEIHNMLFRNYMTEPFSLSDEEYEAIYSLDISKMIKVILDEYVSDSRYVSKDWQDYIEDLTPKMKKLFLKGVYSGYEDALKSGEAKLPHILKKKMSPVELINAILDAKKNGLLYDPYNTINSYEEIEDGLVSLANVSDEEDNRFFIDGLKLDKNFGFEYDIEDSWIELLREMFRDPNAIKIKSVKEAEEWARNRMEKGK